MTTLTPALELPRPIRILVISPHHDDIEFGPAGTIACWIDQGAEVTYCLVTDGGAGSNDPSIDRETLVALRKKEQLAAAEQVGVSDVRFLDYPDGVLQPSLELRRDLTRLIREIRPERVLISDPTLVVARNSYINHPDHRAAAESAMHAIFPSAETRPIFPELLAEGYEPHKVSDVFVFFPGEPSHWVDTTAGVDRKLAALACHGSQVAPERLPEIREGEAETGRRFGVDYAELFRVIQLRPIPTNGASGDGQG